MLCVQVVGDSTVLKEKVAHCHLKRLELWGDSNLLPLLSGAKDNCSVTILYVQGEPITTCLHVTILYHVRALYIGYRVCTCMGWAICSDSNCADLVNFEV